MPTLPIAYTAVLADLLYAHSGELVGIYDLRLGWFTHVNPAGVRLLASRWWQTPPLRSVPSPGQ